LVRDAWRHRATGHGHASGNEWAFHSVPRCAAIVSRPIQYDRGQMGPLPVFLSALTGEFGWTSSVPEAASPHSDHTAGVAIARRPGHPKNSAALRLCGKA